MPSGRRLLYSVIERRRCTRQRTPRAASYRESSSRRPRRAYATRPRSAMTMTVKRTEPLIDSMEKRKDSSDPKAAIIVVSSKAPGRREGPGRSGRERPTQCLAVACAGPRSPCRTHPSRRDAGDAAPDDRHDVIYGVVAVVLDPAGDHGHDPMDDYTPCSHLGAHGLRCPVSAAAAGTHRRFLSPPETTGRNSRRHGCGIWFRLP